MSAGAADPPPEGVPPLPEDGLLAWLPGLWVLRHYRRTWLAHDLSAGLVLSALLVPAGMGYAQASGLPAVTGLYATVGGLVAYALFGPSRILVVGPDSALTALVAAAVVGPAAGDPARATALAALLALFTGVLCVVAGLARAGFVTELLSKPVRVGYLHGIALTVIVSQLPRLFGFSVSEPDVPGALAGFARGLVDGRARPLALALGVGSLAVVLVARRIAPRLPGVLVAVAGATAFVLVGGLEARVPIVGALPPGLPLPRLPSASLEELSALATAAMGIALVSFADTRVLSRAFAARTGHRLDANRELVGLGLANLAAGLVQGFPVSGSASRTPVAAAAGARTQLTGLVGALVIVASEHGVVRAPPEALEELDAELTARGVELAFAELKGPVKDRLRRYGLAERIGRDFFFPTLGVAVKSYLQRHEVAWSDWEDHGTRE